MTELENLYKLSIQLNEAKLIQGVERIQNGGSTKHSG